MLALYGWALEPGGAGGAADRLLDRLVASGLPFVEREGARLFDPAEAINRVIAAGLADEEPAWRGRFVATGQRLARSLDPSAPQGAMLPPRRFRVDFARGFDLAGLAASERLRLRLPAPIEDHALTDLSLAIAAPAGEVAQQPGRIEVRLGPRRPERIEIAFTAHFTSRPACNDTAPPDPADHRWLAPDEGFVQVTPAVRMLAARLAGGAVDARRAVAAFRDHLLDRFGCGIVAYEAIVGPATDHVLAGGWYDCQLGSALLVALCRARDTPARLVGGYLLWPASPSRHIWCEIWLDGRWTPYDLLAWDLSAGGRDAAWRGAFAGRIDHRMKTEMLPAIFTGPMSLPFPAAHHRLVSRDGAGIAIDHRTLDGAPLYRDRISVVPDPA